MAGDSERGMAHADREVLHAAATGEGLIPISVDELQELAAAARATMTHFENAFADMTQEQAAFVRNLRCVDDYTWRAVADTCSLEWSGDWGSNQLAGMALCEKAAAMHGEDYMKEPWN